MLTTYNNFAELDIKVGEITEVLDFSRARNPAYKVQVKFSDNDSKWSSAQITEYSKEELIGKQVICIVNLPERNIAGFMSQVLILGVPDKQGNTILIKPDQQVETGVKVF